MVKIAIYIAVKREESLIKANSSGSHMAQNNFANEHQTGWMVASEALWDTQQTNKLIRFSREKKGSVSSGAKQTF